MTPAKPESWSSENGGVLSQEPGDTSSHLLDFLSLTSSAPSLPSTPKSPESEYPPPYLRLQSTGHCAFGPYKG